MGVQSEASACAHVNSSTVAQQMQLKSHAETGRAVASRPSRGDRARRALVQHHSYADPQDSESRPSARSSRSNCTLRSPPGVFGSSCDMLCYGHVSGQKCVCAPDHFGYDCSLCAKADPARSFSQRLAAGEPALLGAVPGSAVSGGVRRDGWGDLVDVDTRIGLTIPSGALTETLVVGADVFPVMPLLGPEQRNLTPRAQIVQLRPHGLEFAMPITLHISVPAPTPAQTTDRPDSELMVMHLDEEAQQWRPADGSAWTTIDGILVISAQTSHFSQWSVFSAPIPPSATPPPVAPPSPQTSPASGSDQKQVLLFPNSDDEQRGIFVVIGLCAGWGGIVLCGAIFLAFRWRQAALWKAALRDEITRKRLEDEERMRESENDQLEPVGDGSMPGCRHDSKKSQASERIVSAGCVFPDLDQSSGACRGDLEVPGKEVSWNLPHDIQRDNPFQLGPHDLAQASDAACAQQRHVDSERVSIDDSLPASVQGPAEDRTDESGLPRSNPFQLMPMIPPARPGTLLYQVEQRRRRKSNQSMVQDQEFPRTSHQEDTIGPRHLADRLHGLIRMSLEDMCDDTSGDYVWSPACAPCPSVQREALQDQTRHLHDGESASAILQIRETVDH